MPSSRRIRCVRSAACSPARGTADSVSEETPSRYPTPAASITTSPGSRETTVPRTEAITRSASAEVRAAACASAAGGASSSERLLQRRAVRVADRHRERVRGVVRLRRLGQRQERSDHPLNLALRGGAASADGLLHGLRRIREARDARHAGGKEHDAAGLAYREGGVGVAAEVEILDRQRGRRVLADEIAHARVDLGEAPLER